MIFQLVRGINAKAINAMQEAKMMRRSQLLSLLICLCLMGAEDGPASISPWWWEFSVLDIGYVWCQADPRAFLVWLGIQRRERSLIQSWAPCSCWRPCEQEASLFTAGRLSFLPLHRVTFPSLRWKGREDSTSSFILCPWLSNL